MRFLMVHSLVHSLVGKGRDLPLPLLRGIQCGTLRHARFWRPSPTRRGARGAVTRSLPPPR